MTDKGKEKLTIGIVIALVTGGLAVAAALLTKPSVTTIVLPGGESVNAAEIVALQTENAALQSENAALRESLTAKANAVPEMSSSPATEALTEGAITTKSPTVQYLLDVAPATNDHLAKSYSSQKSGNGYFEMAGKKYSDGIVWSPQIDRGAFSIHSLHGEYTRIEGIIGHIDGAPMKEITLWISYDGIVKHEFSIRGGMYPEPLILDDLQDVKQIKFETSGTKGSYSQFGFANITIE